MQSPGKNSHELFCTITVFHVQEVLIQAKVVAEMGYSTGLGNGKPGIREESERLWSGSSRVWRLMSGWTKQIKGGNNYLR